MNIQTEGLDFADTYERSKTLPFPLHSQRKHFKVHSGFQVFATLTGWLAYSKWLTRPAMMSNHKRLLFLINDMRLQKT